MGKNDVAYKKSEFRQNTFFTTRSENTQEDQAFVTSKMTDERVMGQMSLNLNVMSERFADQFGEEVIPQQTLEERVDTFHQDVLKDSKLSQSQKTKRAKSAAKKIEDQKNLREEKRLLVQKLKDDNVDVAKRMSPTQTLTNASYTLQGTMENFEAEYQTEEEKEAVQRWIIIKATAEGQNDSMREGLILPNRSEMSIRWMNILDEVNQADVTEFSYKSDSEFISEFARKYEQISKYALAEVFYQKVVDIEEKGELSGYARMKTPMREARARIEVFKKLKQEYEERMELISSPYYALLAEKDISGYKNERDIRKLEEKGAEPEFIEYVKRYQRLNKSDVGKGKSVKDVYEKTLEKYNDLEAQRDLAKIEELTGGVQIIGEGVGAGIMFFHNKKEKNLESYPPDDMQYLTEVKLIGEKFAGVASEQEMRELEEKIISVMNTQTVDGHALDADAMEEMREQLKLIAEKRRLYTATFDAYETTFMGAAGFGLDFTNPKLKKNARVEQVKNMLMDRQQQRALSTNDIDVQLEDGSTLHITRMDTQRPESNAGYTTEIINCMAKLHKFGGVINKEMEDNLKDDAKKEKQLKDFKNAFCNTYDIKESDFDPSMIPTVTYGGVTYKTYFRDTGMEEIIKNLNKQVFSEEENQIVTEKLAKIAEICEKRARLLGELGGGSGIYDRSLDRMIIKQAYEADYEKELGAVKRELVSIKHFENLKKSVDPALAGKVNTDMSATTYYAEVINQSDYCRPGMKGVMDDIQQELIQKGYSATNINHDICHAGDSFIIRGLNKVRILAGLEGSIGEGMTKEDVTALMEKLCAIDTKELNKDDSKAVKDADAKVDEGIRQYKGMVYNFLKKLEATYGTLITQMHPEDFFRQVGPEFKDHLAGLQDATQLLRVPWLFDLKENEEDQEFKRLSDYYNNAMMSVTSYATNMYEVEHGRAKSSDIEFFVGVSTNFVKKADMTGVGGPSMSPTEMEEYRRDLDKRAAAGGWSNRLF